MTVTPVTRLTVQGIGVIGTVDVLCDNSCTGHTTGITGLTPTNTELQIVNKSIVLEERLLADTPSTSH